MGTGAFFNGSDGEAISLQQLQTSSCYQEMHKLNRGDKDHQLLISVRGLWEYDQEFCSLIEEACELKGGVMKNLLEKSLQTGEFVLLTNCTEEFGKLAEKVFGEMARHERVIFLYKRAR
ncbi:MAG: hypothetical protein QM535_21095 [Limnohabitans sp.]|nr:hypothetical protein [Limnohabitans sp.]